MVTREDGDKTHGVALIFYEEVKDLNICHAVHTLQKMYSTEAEGGTLKRTDRLRPRSAKASQGGASSERSRSLPRHYQQVSELEEMDCPAVPASYSRTPLQGKSVVGRIKFTTQQSLY